MDQPLITRWHAQLLAGECAAVNVQTGQAIGLSDLPEEESERLIFPGAFNPLHAGHRAMDDFATHRLGLDTEFELSIDNVDKSPLSPDEVRVRLQQLPPTQTVWLTRAMRFTDKATLFPQATFIVGADTMARIGDLSYYHGDPQKLNTAIEHLAACKCRFLVFARTLAGDCQSASNITLPAELQALCIEVPPNEFHIEISSTEMHIADDSR